MSTLSTVAAALPFFEAGHIRLPFPVLGHLDLQYFGILVATGVLIGANLMRRYGDKFAVDDDDMRGMVGWVVATGFIGAHVFDVLAYQSDELAKKPLLLLQLWKGISSYGGFIGGAMGWWFYQWWKRLQTGLWADATVLGLLVAFSIGRIGCTVVSDHIGSPTASIVGMDYPIAEVKGRLCPQFGDLCPDWLDAAYKHHDDLAHLPVVAPLHRMSPPLDPPLLGGIVRLHNLGLNELMYLVGVNLLVLWLCFGRKKRAPAGFIAVLAGMLYAPVRFFFEYLRPVQTDPRYLGLTFAQWASILAFSAAAFFMVKLLRHGKPALLADEIDPRYMGGRRDNVPRALHVETKKPTDAKGGAKKAEPAKQAESAKKAAPAPVDDPPAADDAAPSEAIDDDGDAAAPADEAPPKKPSGGLGKKGGRKRR